MLAGSFLSSRAPDRIVRPIITFVIFASGLKYVGVSTTALGWILCVTVLLVATLWAVGPDRGTARSSRAPKAPPTTAYGLSTPQRLQ